MKTILKSVFLILFLSICLIAVRGQNTADEKIAELNAEVSREYAAKDYDSALIAATKLVELSKQKYGKNDVAVARALRIKGKVEDARGDWLAGENSFKEAAEIFKKQASLSKEDGNVFAGILEAIADIQTADLPAAEKNLRLALKWRESSNGIDSPEAARTIGDLANVRFLNGDYKEAAELNKRSLLLLAKNPADWTNELRAVTYYRTQCSYRKAKIENQFESVKKEFEDQIAVSLKDSTEIISQAGIINGRAVSLGRPVYSRDAKEAGASGVVRVEVLISKKGEVLTACATADSKRLLTRDAERAAYRSKFGLTTMKGVPVLLAGILTFNFVNDGPSD